jgi:hypothetical protein
MNCPDCLERLQRRLDGETLPDAAALDAHLAVCADCRTWYDAAQRLSAGLALLAAPVPDPALADRIVNAVLAQERACRRLRRWLGAGAAVAAAVLLATVAGTLGRAPTPGPGPQKPSEITQNQVAPAPAAAAPSLRESVEEARSAVAALTDDLRAKTKEQAELLWTAAQALGTDPMPPLPGVGDLEPPLEPAAQTVLESGRAVSVSLQTVAGSARRAVNYFLRELPPLETERKSGL